MSIKKLEDERYFVDLRPNGVAGRRIQRVFSRKADAVAFEKYVIANSQGLEWQPARRDTRHLSQLIEPWWALHGRSLEFGRNRRAALLRIVAGMRDPLLVNMKPCLLMHYRTERLSTGVKASTINRDMAVLSGMFNILISAGEFSSCNPVRELRPLKEKAVQMAFLTTEEVNRLLDALVPGSDAYRVTVLCLSTGARWGEATALSESGIMRDRITFVKTKNGKQRTVPVSPSIVNIIRGNRRGRLFDLSYHAYRDVLRSVKPDLPRGQAAHILRHTFAAHFMMNGGNILTLQRIMGHASIQQTMTYAHFAPDFLQEAVKYNPVAGRLDLSQEAAL